MINLLQQQNKCAMNERLVISTLVLYVQWTRVNCHVKTIG